MAAETYTYRRLQFGLQEVGFVNLVQDGEINFTGESEDLEAIEGTIGILAPKSKGMEISGTLFVPAATEAYSKILDFWQNDTEVSMIAWFGQRRAFAKGHFNAPAVTEDGTRMTFTFRGKEPRIASTA